MYKFLLSTIIAVIYLVQPLSAQHEKHGLTWYDDITQVYELSKKTGKPVFAFFTGSDWCGWCHKLERAVFEKESFQTWAKEKVILLELDYPRKKQLPEKLAKQNQDLAAFFKVQGFPTIWLFDINRDTTNNRFNIEPYGSLGYPAGSPKGKEDQTFLKNVNKLLNNKEQS